MKTVGNHRGVDITQHLAKLDNEGIVWFKIDHAFFVHLPQPNDRTTGQVKKCDSGEIRTLAPESNRLAVCRLNHSATLSDDARVIRVLCIL